MYSYLKRIIGSSRGFSLTEVMVGGAILAGVGLAGSKLLRDQRFAQKNVENDQSLTIFHQGLVKTLVNTGTCNATFSSWYGNTIPAGPLSIYRCSGLCNDKRLDASDITRGAAIWDITNTSLWIDNKRVWKINNIEVVSAVTSSGPLRLKVTYQINPSLPNSKTVSKDIIINVRFNNAGGFKECTNNEETSVNNLQNDICKSLNYNQVDSNGHVARWNEDRQECEMIDTGKNCPAGEVIEGVRSDGSVHCAPATRNFDSSVDLAGPQNCPSGTRMVFVGNRIEIQCL